MTTKELNTLNGIIETQTTYLSDLKRQKELYKNTILIANYVITVNDIMTVGVKREDGKKWLENRYGVLPTLFTKEGAEQNKEALEANENENVKIFNKTIWYRNEIERVEQSIESIKKVINQ